MRRMAVGQEISSVVKHELNLKCGGWPLFGEIKSDFFFNLQFWVIIKRLKNFCGLFPQVQTRIILFQNLDNIQEAGLDQV